MNSKGKIAVMQILILVIGILATVWVMGGVSGTIQFPTEEELTKLIQKEQRQQVTYGIATDMGTGAAIWDSFTWAAGAWGIISMFGSMFWDKEQTQAVSKAALFGMLAGKLTMNILASKENSLGKWFADRGKSWLTPTTAGWIVGGAIFLWIYMKENKQTTTQTITYTCSPWDAPVGGSNCEKCNQQGLLPCSEYQCRSLGQSCELVNSETEEAKCVWVNRHDVKPPVIQPFEEALLDDYKYTPDNTISPPDRGVKIQYTKSSDKCVPAFTPLSFGIKTDEPSKCKIDYIRKDKLENMEFYFGGSSTFKYEHTQVLSLPGPSAEANNTPIIENDRNFELFTRCADANGNENTANFVFKFCVDKGPDTTPPLIVTTSLLNNMPIAFNQSTLDISLYVNEPAECMWSHLDKDYDEMEEEMVCSIRVTEMNAQMLYECKTTLTGLKNRYDNKFYFRCRDNPYAAEADRNTNAESYEFTAVGTQPLVISSVEPNNETIRDSADSVKVPLEVETSAGYKEGKANCYYSETGNEDDYILFYETNSHKHKQELWLLEGEYTYYIKCIDLGGNSDYETIEFEVESDSEAPMVVRAYKEDNYLKIQTDEKAECVYDTQDCTYLFDDGLSMTTSGDTTHYTSWGTDHTLYIKCKDEYDNQPDPDECSIIIRPIDV